MTDLDARKRLDLLNRLLHLKADARELREEFLRCHLPGEVPFEIIDIALERALATVHGSMFGTCAPRPGEEYLDS